MNPVSALVRSVACRAAFAAGLLLGVAGCAGPTPLTQSQELVRHGLPLEAVELLEAAAREQPGVPAYRAALLRAREQAVLSLLREADDHIAAGRLDEAEGRLQQLDAAGLGQPRVASRQRAIAQRRRSQEQRAAARQAQERHDEATARELLQALLQDDPGDDEARRLLERLAPAPQGLSQPPALSQALRKPVTIEFRDAPLRSVFDLLARNSGLNFVFDKDVRTDQKTSIFLKDATIEAAVQRILLTNQLEQRVLDHNTLLVYPATAAKQKDYQPLVVRAFYLAHADAKAVAGTLKTLLKGREPVVDEKLNLIILRDSPDLVAVGARLIALHDLPEPEVMLEVEILEIKRTRLLDLGARWPDQLSLTPLPSAAGAPLTLADVQGLNSRSIGATLSPLTLNARRSLSDANILANPRIRARNREKARILIGERVPNITTTSTSTGFVAESVTYVDVGLKLDVEPTVYLDGEVAIKIALEVSNIINQLQTKSGSIAYQIGTRTAQTVLRLKDGENQVLAGLINDEDRRTANRLPGLGDVPVLGRLFGSQADDHSKTEIVLSITPRVLRNVQRPVGAAAQFESGTEAQAGVVWGRSGGAVVAAAAATQSTPGQGQATPAPVPPPAATAPASASAAATPSSRSEPPKPAFSDPGVAPSPAQPSRVPAGSPAIELTWSGPAEARVGDTASLQLNLRASPALQRLPLTIGFDPQLLQVVSVGEAEPSASGGAERSAARLVSRVDPSGQILLTAQWPADMDASASAGPAAAARVAPPAAPLATLRLRVTSAASASTQLRVLGATGSTSSGESIDAQLPPAHQLRIVGTAAANTPGPAPAVPLVPVPAASPANPD